MFNISMFMDSVNRLAKAAAAKTEDVEALKGVQISITEARNVVSELKERFPMLEIPSFDPAAISADYYGDGNFEGAAGSAIENGMHFANLQNTLPNVPDEAEAFKLAQGLANDLQKEISPAAETLRLCYQLAVSKRNVGDSSDLFGRWPA